MRLSSIDDTACEGGRFVSDLISSIGYRAYCFDTILSNSSKLLMGVMLIDTESGPFGRLSIVIISDDFSGH